jgi:hypothetical protein
MKHNKETNETSYMKHVLATYETPLIPHMKHGITCETL